MNTNSRQVALGIWLIVAAFTLIFLWLLSHWLISVLVDCAWFQSLGLEEVFWKQFNTKLLLFATGFFFSVGFVWANLYWADRVPKDSKEIHESVIRHYIDPVRLRSLSRRFMTLVSLGGACFLGLSLARHWESWLLWLYGPSFNLIDPLFKKDAGFYVFFLPVAFALFWYFIGLFILTVLVITVHYAATSEIVLESHASSIGTRAFRHFSILCFLLLLLTTTYFQLNKYVLLYTQSRSCAGPGYAEVFALYPAYTFMQLVSFVFAIWLIFNTYFTVRPTNAYLTLIFIVIWAIATKVYPFVFHSIVVKPNEFEREKVFIEHSLKFTRHAFGLDEVKEIPWDGDALLTSEKLTAAEKTLDNISIWDELHVSDALQQKQRIRSYYDLSEVDTDRYEIDGTLRPVLVSVRELDARRLPEGANIWTNVHMQFTHGFGFCLALANKSTQNGLPAIVLGDLQPVSTTYPFHVEQPRVYFGERTDHYVLVKTKLEEFDYPGDQDNFFTQYQGKDGISTQGLFRRILLAFYTGDKEVFFTRQLREDSRILLYRQIRQRVMTIAPFFSYDDDPYAVLNDGRIYWIIDGYTLTDRFPYSESVARANYVRNAVKAVVDAYDGTVTFYVVNDKEPIIAAWRSVFPTLFKKLDDMPAGLKRHVRYPKDLFRIQTVVYRRYHVTDPQVFFNREDMWTFPRESSDSKGAFDEPRYIVMELPESERGQEFLVARSFTVEGKDNMIAWICGRCDGDQYGKLLVFRMPKGRNIYGPAQMRGRFNQVPEVSAFHTLMGQIGSTVKGTTVFPVPIANSFLYVQSLFVVDPEVKIPELKQVVVGHGDKVSMAPTLKEALEKLFGDNAVGENSVGLGSQYLSNPTAWSNAAALYEEANRRIKSGDWAGFGEAFRQLGELISSQSDLDEKNNR